MRDTLQAIGRALLTLPRTTWPIGAWFVAITVAFRLYQGGWTVSAAAADIFFAIKTYASLLLLWAATTVVAVCFLRYCAAMRLKRSGRMPTSADLARNHRTVAAYDDYAAKYAEVTAPGKSQYGFDAVDRFARAVGPGARVLEVASGPGWDADAMEAKGLTVHRTDLSEGFIAVQAKRGKTVHRLDLLADDLGGPWDGLAALYVLQHIERDQLEGVIARIVAALRPGGVFLTSFQEGEGECEQQGSEGGVYHVVQWTPDDLLAVFARQGLAVEWRHSFEGDEARWSVLIARRS